MQGFFNKHKKIVVFWVALSLSMLLTLLFYLNEKTKLEAEIKYILFFVLIFILTYSSMLILKYLNISDSIKTEHNLDKIKDIEINNLKQNEKYRREFVGNVSHELKTPIFNIQGYVYTLLDTDFKNKEIHYRFLSKTASNIDRLINIVEDLDSITKLESGILKLEYSYFDISEMITEVFEMTEIKASQQNYNLKLINLTKNTDVFADKQRISQVLINLVSNSIRYGKEFGTTEVKLIDDTDYQLLISVSDNGTGISDEDLPRIFERFYRVDKSRSKDSGGTGLGLSIVKHIIEAHNKEILVQSKLGEGSCFSFKLPKYNFNKLR